ncbi:MAG: hypothetical protein C4536_14930 [Actinobacteria bacterium]|jgi:hypothetical protein|nr:MAG: hypothetical protein C4536_14930 [Actinomycetota bacterium]
MKVVVLNPWKVFAAGVISCLLVAGSVLGGLALWGVFDSDTAEAYGAAGVGAKTWYFAEGYTGPGFEEWILLYNPPENQGGSGIVVQPGITMYSNGGLIGEAYSPPLLPGQRASININDAAAYYGYSGDVSIVVYSNTYPFLCERALYFNYKGQITGGSQSWGYQEGATE